MGLLKKKPKPELCALYPKSLTQSRKGVKFKLFCGLKKFFCTGMHAAFPLHTFNQYGANVLALSFKHICEGLDIINANMDKALEKRFERVLL